MSTWIALGAVALALYFNSELKTVIRELQHDVDGLRKEMRGLRSSSRRPLTDTGPRPSVAELPSVDPGPAVDLSETEFGILAQFLERRMDLSAETRQRMEGQLVARFEARIPLAGREPFFYLSDIHRRAVAEQEGGADDLAPDSERPIRAVTLDGSVGRAAQRAATTPVPVEGDQDRSTTAEESEKSGEPPQEEKQPVDRAPDAQPVQPAGVAASQDAPRDFETVVGTTWTLRIGLGAIAIAAALFARTIVPSLPPGAKVALAYAGALGLFAVGMVFEEKLKRFARPVMAGGLSVAFFVSFAAYFVPAMRAVPMVASLAWMTAGVLAVLVLATRWNSESTAGLAIFLGHVSAFVAAGDADGYSLVVIAFLSVTAVVLMHRNNWLRLSLFAVVAAYASHFLWAMVAHDTMPLARALVLNLMFLSSYYVIFLTADLLWWRRKTSTEENETAALGRRVLGPANLVFYVSLVSFLYATIPGPPQPIEWFYFILAAVQAALALEYRRLGNPDYGFFAALGTILLTFGFFAALDALALNLILALQALVLLLAAHRTRLRVFHLLAQVALGVNFVHYWTVGVSATATVPLFLGGLAIAGVYFTKSQLEEIWYAKGAAGWKNAEEPAAPVRILAQWFDEGFESISPYLGHLHAVAGALILVREIRNYFPSSAELGVVVVALVLIGAGALVRRSIPLALAYLVVQAGIVALAAEAAPEGIMIRMGVVAACFAVPTLMAVTAPRRFVASAMQSALGITQVGLWIAVMVPWLLVWSPSSSLPVLAQYLLWIGVVAVIFAYADRSTDLFALAKSKKNEDVPTTLRAMFTDAIERVTEGLPAVVTAGLGAGLVTLVTQRLWGSVVAAPVWTSLWTVALVGVASWRRNPAHYAAGFVLMGATYVYFLVGFDLSGDVAVNVGASAFVIAVPLLIALGQDGLASRYAPQLRREWVDLATYIPYGLASVFLAYVLAERIDYPRAIPAFTLLPVALLLGARWISLSRGAVVAVVAMLLAVAGQVGPLLNEDVVVLWPGLLVAAAALVVERLVNRYQLDAEGAVDMVSLALVAAGVGLAFMAVLRSPSGEGWTTAGWSIIAAIVMVLGFAMRAAVYRRLALGAFALSIVRIFVVDVRGLSSGQQTLAFLILGVSLVAVAWLYARFAQQLRKWL